MIAAGSLEFALARMQARLAHRPTEGAWAAIEEARGIGPVLDVARDTTLGPLVAALPPAPDLAAADRAARQAWTRAVTCARAWMPPAWGEAIAWCDGPRATGAPQPYPTILPSLGHPGWRRRWPAGASDDAELAELARRFERHLARFRRARPHEAVSLRRAFEAGLLAAFRRHPGTPAAAFAWLALAALDIERLRGELARRLAFPDARIAA